MIETHPGRATLCLTIPGLGGSDPRHWQSIWERERPDCERIHLGCWDSPVRNLWITRIDQAVSAAPGPVILVAHSLGCLAVAWWATLTGEAAGDHVRGALLVAPPDVDTGLPDARLARFAPAPKAPLPFPAIVVASRDDPYCAFARAEALAGGWLARFVDAGAAGHLNTASGLGAWREGQALLDGLAEASTAAGPPRLPAVPARIGVPVRPLA